MDDELLERLLQAPECAADEVPGLARLLDVASTYPSTLGSMPGEDAALVAFRNRAITVPSRRKHMLGKALAAKSLAALAAGTLTLGGGVAAAATGSLPPQAQDKVAGVAGHVGIDFPNSHGHHNGWEKGNNPHKTPSTSDDTTKDSTNDGDSSKPADNHGADVSKVAHDTDPGPGHGEAVSKTARDNHGADESASTGSDATETKAGDDDAADQAQEAQEKAQEAQEQAQEQQSEAPETESSEAPDTDSGSSGRPTDPSGGHAHAGATG